tara:strand:+ start:1410 stop:3629 length:2220 start_codon:yes stop_codon:yes gene_type:complete
MFKNKISNSLFILLFYTVLVSDTIRFTDIDDESVTINIISENNHYLIIEYSINYFDINKININNEEYYNINLDNEPKFITAKKPELPHVNRSFIIPNTRSLSVQVLQSEYTDYAKVDIVPSKGNITRNIDISTLPYIKGDVYDVDAYYPKEITSIHNPYILRNFRGQVLQVNPFQYNPVTSSLKVFNKLILKVEFNGENKVNQLIQDDINIKKITKDFEYIYSDRFLNYSSYKLRYDPIQEDGEMLVICYDSFCDAMDPFVSWKNQKGIKTTLEPLSNVGNTYNSIKNYIENFYNNNNLSYVLLVGDINQIPSKSTGNGWSAGESDPWYSYMTNDSYPEFFVGRFSAENIAHVQTQVERSIQYERDPQLNAQWYKKGVMIASNEGPGDDNEDDWEHARNLRELLLDYSYSSIDELYDGNHANGGVDSNGNPNSTSLRNVLNDGRGILHYTGHGETTYFVTTSFGTSDANSLTNNNELPFACAVGCISGNFAGNTCLAESLQRSTNNNQPTGTIASFMSTIYMGWSPPMEAQDEMVDILVESYNNNRKYTFGGISYNGCLKMNDSYGSEGDSETDHWTIFGDPSIELRTDIPSNLNISHEGYIAPNAEAYEIIINSTDDNIVAALSHEGQFLGSAYENNNTCVIVLEESISDFSELTLTVTGYNKIPVIETVTIGNSCPSDVMGDLNGDLNINIQDIVLLVSVVLGVTTPDECQAEVGDLNFDGLFNVLDIVNLVTIILD